VLAVGGTDVFGLVLLDDTVTATGTGFATNRANVDTDFQGSPTLAITNLTSGLLPNPFDESVKGLKSHAQDEIFYPATADGLFAERQSFFFGYSLRSAETIPNASSDGVWEYAFGLSFELNGLTSESAPSAFSATSLRQLLIDADRTGVTGRFYEWARLVENFDPVAQIVSYAPGGVYHTGTISLHAVPEPSSLLVGRHGPRELWHFHASQVTRRSAS
jgi:hypothetical protein